MVAHVEHGAPPPPELIAALSADRWNTLPNSGGLYDQPAGWMATTAQLLNVFRAYSSYKRMDVRQLEAHSPELHAIFQEMEALRHEQ